MVRKVVVIATIASNEIYLLGRIILIPYTFLDILSLKPALGLIP